MNWSNRLAVVLLSATLSAVGVFAEGKEHHFVPAENKENAYGELHRFVCDRIRLWPDLAPHETVVPTRTRLLIAYQGAQVARGILGLMDAG